MSRENSDADSHTHGVIESYRQAPGTGRSYIESGRVKPRRPKARSKSCALIFFASASRAVVRPFTAGSCEEVNTSTNYSTEAATAAAAEADTARPAALAAEPHFPLAGAGRLGRRRGTDQTRPVAPARRGWPSSWAGLGRHRMQERC